MEQLGVSIGTWAIAPPVAFGTDGGQITSEAWALSPPVSQAIQTESVFENQKWKIEG